MCVHVRKQLPQLTIVQFQTHDMLAQYNRKERHSCHHGGHNQSLPSMSKIQPIEVYHTKNEVLSNQTLEVEIMQQNKCKLKPHKLETSPLKLVLQASYVIQTKSMVNYNIKPKKSNSAKLLCYFIGQKTKQNYLATSEVVYIAKLLMKC